MTSDHHSLLGAGNLHLPAPSSTRRRKYPRGEMSVKVQAYAEANPLLTFREIGDHFGLTKERVRKIMKTYANVTGKERQKYRAQQRVTITTRSFISAVRRWLREIGYGYCGCSLHDGGRCIPVSNIDKKHTCLECNARRVSDYYHRAGILVGYYPDSRRKYKIRGEDVYGK